MSPTPLRAAPNRYRPTDEQEVILEEFLDGNTTVASALAGTGKTSTLVMCSKATEMRGAYWAFNKSIADEAADKMPPRVMARTASSFAFRAMIREIPWMEYRLGKRVKPWEMAQELGIKRGRVQVGSKSFSHNKLASLAMDMVGNFCQSDDQVLSRRHVPFVRGLEAQYAPDGSALVASSLPELAEVLLPIAEAYWKDVQHERGKVRFTFDHYMKMWALGEYVKPEIPGEYVMVDEAQDLNPVEIGILTRMGKQMLVVGDANQQIYEFRGSVNAMERFAPSYAHLPLTMSFRFGERIASAANQFLTILDAPELIRGNPNKDGRLLERGENDHPHAVLTRSNAGALEMLLAELERGDGKRIAVTGKIKAMTTFIEAAAKMQAGQIVTHPDLVAFKDWEAVRAYVRESNDRDYATLVKLIDKHGTDRLEEALSATVPLDEADLAISTAHSAKGLEWPSVKLGNDFEPEEDEGPSPSEMRLAYVAVTRAEVALDPGGLRPYLEPLYESEAPDGV